MQFKDIIGNNQTKKHLVNSLKQNRLSHSQLFLGKEGSPKLAFAIAFAQYINCTNKLKTDACGQCDSCIKYNLLIHPDLHLVFPVLSIRGIKKAVSDHFVKEWRAEVLRNPYLNLNNWFDVFSSENKLGKRGYIYTQESDQLHQKLLLKHYESKYRVVIIWLPEQMQRSTSNKLLKLLEEPPTKTIFLLVSENKELLLNTITSRLQTIKIRDFTEHEKTEILKNKFPEKKIWEIERIISFSNGNLGNSIFNLGLDVLLEDNFEDFKNWMRLCYSLKIQEIIGWVNERSKKGRENQVVFLKYSLKMIRNCLIVHFSDLKTLNITDNEKAFLSKFHPFIHEDNIVEISEKIEESIKNIERNANTKIILYELSLQLTRQLKVNRKFVELKV